MRDNDEASRKSIPKHFEYWIVLEALEYDPDNLFHQTKSSKCDFVALTIIPIPKRHNGQFRIMGIERIGQLIDVQFGDFLRHDIDLDTWYLERSHHRWYRLFMAELPMPLVNKLMAERPMLDSFFED